MKQKLSIILAVLLAFTPSMFIPVQGDEYYRQLWIYFNGERMYTGLTYIDDGRTMVTLRRTVEEMGGKVVYDRENKSVEITYLDRKAVLYEYSDTMQITRDDRTWIDVGDYMPFYNNYGDLMVPVRAIADAFGLDIQWNPEYYAVVMLDTEPFWDKVSQEAPVFYDMLVQEPKRETGKIQGNLNYLSDSVNSKFSLTADLNGRTKDDAVYLKSDFNLNIEYEGEKEAIPFGVEFLQKDGYTYCREYYENPLFDGPEVLWNRTEGPVIEQNLPAKDIIEEMLAEEGRIQYPEKSYESLDTLTNLFIMLEMDYIKQSSEEDVTTTQFLLNNDNAESFLKEFGRIYGYRDMTLEEYDEYCRSIDDMLEKTKLSVNLDFITKPDGSQNSRLKCGIITGEETDKTDIAIHFELAFTPSNDIEEITAPSEDEIWSSKFQQYNSLNNLFSTETEKEAILQCIVPFYSNFAHALNK